ncbi:hypothetical protein K431DRAFT_350639 [Polychaeton citri CBS 116435]|uniref:Uncharacterized protein n=1 Tax=Polychaeton citri CBS 116435 TaxID=1314669 RepID=A0A9P4UK79_9PEZI|nr:hypothetical protein K431DRAFT_350639 [Polychaeton citri CBS 116435]
MPFVTSSLCRALSTAVLFSAATVAQTCFFPDGSEAAGHVPCSSDSGVSSCCSSSAFCMDNGLCYGSGLLSRGSCTDSTWNNDQCGLYCTDVETSTSVSIMPCSTSKFTCGLNASNCETNTDTFTMQGGNHFILRADQIASLVTPALQSSNTVSPAATVTATITAAATARADTRKQYSGGDMAGLACGLALPLLAGLIAALFALRRERQKYAQPKLMYKLPDGHDSFDPREYKPPPPVMRSASALSLGSPSAPSVYSNPASPVERSESQMGNMPPHIQNLLSRIDSTKKMKMREAGLGVHPVVRHELDTAPPYRAADKPAERHELANVRMST